MNFSLLPLPVHSAHIGQEVEVHYRWHPLFRRRVKVRDVEQRGGGRVVHIDAGDSEVRVIAEWMLDAAACSALVLGEPRVSVAALCNLHQLLINRHLRGNPLDDSAIDLRGNSPDDSTIVREKRNAQATKRRAGRPAVVATNFAPDEHDVRLDRASGDEPGAAFKRHQTPRELASTGRRRRASKGA
ncbi:hypothetical protein [Caballeronia sordidicola]|uniref:hypothetical protein n=1 Tax=Caballeronia sordidicola TaxID=196367 RepID=UPI0015C07DF9|nr:hypothetical protein [Caballeronia sordidicola]